MPKVLTEQQIADYRRDGYLFPVPAMSEAEAGRYFGQLQAYEADSLGGLVSAVGGAARFKNHLLLTWVNDLVRHPAILDAVEDLIGPDILCYTSTFFVKEPNSLEVAAWHQDATYFGLRPHDHVTAWLAFTESTSESGCLEFLPARNAHRQHKHRNDAVAHSVNGGKQAIVEDLDLDGAVMAPLRPGTFSLHNTLCIHRSAPNKSANRRIGIGISYVPTSVEHIGTQRMPAMLVRGTDSYGHFELEPEPVSDLDDAARAAHEEAYKAYRAHYNEQLTWHQEGRGL